MKKKYCMHIFMRHIHDNNCWPLISPFVELGLAQSFKRLDTIN